MEIVVIPCGAAKAPEATEARNLYTGSMFAHALAAALDITEGNEENVLILSALHGLLRLTDIVAPYDVKMGDAGSVTAATVADQMIALDITDADIFTLLPSAYLTVLDAAARTHYNFVQDVYEADAGIGYQRGTCSSIRRTYNDEALDALLAGWIADLDAAAA